MVHAVAGAHSCNATIQWTKIPYIPVVNSPPMVSLLETVARRFGEHGTWERMQEPLMVGEDFAFLSGNVFTLCNTSKAVILASSLSAKVMIDPDPGYRIPAMSCFWRNWMKKQTYH